MKKCFEYIFQFDESNKILWQVFSGCIDRNTPVQHLFETPFEAQIIRIFPDSWHGSISLKLELIGCGEAPTTTTPAYEFITVSHYRKN